MRENKLKKFSLTVQYVQRGNLSVIRTFKVSFKINACFQSVKNHYPANNFKIKSVQWIKILYINDVKIWNTR